MKECIWADCGRKRKMRSYSRHMLGWNFSAVRLYAHSRSPPKLFYLLNCLTLGCTGFIMYVAIFETTYRYRAM